jgi:hypothetical protein
MVDCLIPAHPTFGALLCQGVSQILDGIETDGGPDDGRGDVYRHGETTAAGELTHDWFDLVQALAQLCDLSPEIGGFCRHDSSSR